MIDQGQDNRQDIDPEFLDVLLQSLTVLSNVATMAAAWIAWRQRPQGAQNESIIDNLRTNVRALRRNLEDCFEAVETILRILNQEGGSRADFELSKERPRFGVGVRLGPEAFGRVHNQLNKLDSHVLQARQAALNVQAAFEYQQTTMPGTENVMFDPTNFNAELNSCLFESSTFGDAMTKLRGVQRRAEDFVAELEKSLRRN